MNRPALERVELGQKTSQPPGWLPGGSIEKRVWAVVGAFALLRLAFLSFPNLFPEEAYYWNYAKHLDYGFLDHPPMVAWLIELGTRCFGDPELGVRVFAFGSSLVTAGFVYRLTALLYSRAVAVFATLLTQALPIYFLTGFIMTPDAPLTACWAGALYFFARVFLTHRSSAWWGVGICLGLGMLSKYTIALLGPSALLFVALDRESRYWLRRVEPYAAALLALLVFSPVIVWNQAHHWASFAFQSANRVREPRRFSLHELMGAVLVLMTPFGVVAVGQVLTGRVPGLPAGELDDAKQSGAWVARRRLFAQTFTLVPLAVFVAFSLVHRVKLNWTGPLWLAVLPAVAALVCAAMRNPPTPWMRRGWQATFALCGALYLVALLHLSFGIPGLPYAQNIDLLPVGWSTMGKSIEMEADELRRQVPANVPVRIVGMDRNFIASEMAFYHSQPARAALETLGSHLFGKISLMYSYWFPAQLQDGSTLLLVSFVRSSLDRPVVQAHAEATGKLETHWLVCRGRKVRPYYTLAVTNYHSASTAP